MRWLARQTGKLESPSIQSLEKGTDVVVLPAACQLTYDHTPPATNPDGHLPTSPELLKLIEQVPETFWGLRLALRVLEQRAQGGASPFSTYIRHLPPTVEGLPMFFSRALLCFHSMQQGALLPEQCMDVAMQGITGALPEIPQAVRELATICF